MWGDGWFKQPHLGKVRLIGLLDWVWLHTCCTLTNQCAQVKPAIPPHTQCHTALCYGVLYILYCITKCSFVHEPTGNTSSSSAPVGPSQNGYTPSSSISCQRPEEDILFQWRLRRKMEQASHWPPAPSQPFPSLHQHQPPSAWQTPPLHQPPSALQNPSLHQHHPPSAWQNPTLHQPPSAWQNPTLHQPPPAGQTSSLHQASVSGSMEHMV